MRSVEPRKSARRPKTMAKTAFRMERQRTPPVNYSNKITKCTKAQGPYRTILQSTCSDKSYIFKNFLLLLFPRRRDFKFRHPKTTTLKPMSILVNVLFFFLFIFFCSVGLYKSNEDNCNHCRQIFEINQKGRRLGDIQ